MILLGISYLQIFQSTFIVGRVEGVGVPVLYIRAIGKVHVLHLTEIISAAGEWFYIMYYIN